MNWRRRKKLWMGKRKLHVSDSVSQCLKCFCVRLLHFYVSYCPMRRIVLAGTNFEPLNPKLIVYCPKRRRTNQSRPPLPDQTRLASSSPQRWRRTDVETRKRWVVVVQLRLILRSYQPTPAPDPKPRCPKQAWQWDNCAAERNTVFLPLQPLRSNRQNFHAQTPRPQTSLSNAGLVDV